MPNKTIKDTDHDQRFDRWLRQQLGDVPQAMIEKWARKGVLRLDGKRAKPSERLKTGQVATFPDFKPAVVHTLPLRPRITQSDRALMKRAVLYQDDHLIVLNKPAGLATQGGSKTLRHVDGLLDVFAQEGRERPKLVHRLDKETSGVLLVARTRIMARWLTQGFKDQKFQKTYHAVVVGVPKNAEGLIEAPIAKQMGRRGEKMVIGGEEAKPAQTYYRVLETFKEPGLSLLELQPLTGRTHQLRVHCAYINIPILGDGKYGGAAAHPFPKKSALHLHAYQITVLLEDGGLKTFEAPWPEHMKETIHFLQSNQ